MQLDSWGAVHYSVSSYMLGAPGVLLWWLPIPFQKETGIVNIDLKLTDSQNRKVIWTHQLYGKVSRVHSMYAIYTSYPPVSANAFHIYRPSKRAGVDRNSLFSWHFAALRKAMMEARPSLAIAMEAER